MTEVTGRKISVTVDKDKNLSELFFDGELIRNVAVGSYIDIRKGFVSLIGKVDGEYARPDSPYPVEATRVPNSKRSLSISLVGYVDRSGTFFGGTKELPLVGNEAYLLTSEKVHQIHNLVSEDAIPLNVAVSDYEGFEISLPVDGLMNSHIAIFGNTGSGKSNTVALLYQSFIEAMRNRNQVLFDQRVRILFFDFNGEYSRENCLTTDKIVYNLSTRHDRGDKVPLSEAGFLDFETLAILSDATEKTQRPFIRRALGLANRVGQGEEGRNHLRNMLRMQITQILQMADKERAFLLIDYMRQILPEREEDGVDVPLERDLEWHNTTAQFIGAGDYLTSNPNAIPNTEIYQRVEVYEFSNDIIADFISTCYVQLIWDVLNNRAQNDHIAPAINKLKSKQADIRKVFDPENTGDVFGRNVVVINLHDVNIEMKKALPLLISKRIYQEQKDRADMDTALSIVIDEAHNILSYESSREAESWKDYRLETFEEIIKEGRKFGVFITVSSQRPSDISQTITSQAHNYFIHRLINNRDLQSIATAVSYIDKITEDSIPTLPTGTCIFSGMAGQMPMKLAMRPLPNMQQPKSTTRKLSDIVPSAQADIIDQSI
ncbi:MULTISPECIES: ATP-binding protein [Jannaschia]|uniref:ATP-binding protein n=1 Tax=Jannaschia TaxID=188905 RepID=UPI001C7DD532|nr:MULTISPECIES: ATP-binding protein [unclassified Jannaschia]